MQALNAVNKRGITTRSIMTVRICKHPWVRGLSVLQAKLVVCKVKMRS